MAHIRATLVAALAAGALLSRSTGASADVLVNDRSGDSCGPPSFSCTQTDPSIVRQGSNLVVGFYADSSGTNRAGWAWSTNSGVSWTDGGTLPRGGFGGSLGGHPAVAVCNGTFFYATEAASTTNEIRVSAGTIAGALAWGAPNLAASNAGAKTPAIACDPAANRLYVAYAGTSAAGNSAILVVASSNGGSTWSAPVTVRETGPSTVASLPSMAVGLDGGVHVAWTVDRTEVNGALFYEVATSNDGGASFGAPVRASNFQRRPPPLGVTALADRGVLVADRSSGANAGNLYLAFQSAEASWSSVRDIFVVRSTNHGASFEPAVVVNHDPLGNDEYMPTIATATSNGTVGVSYYATVPGPLYAVDTWVGMSIDGGQSFVPGVRASTKSTIWETTTSDATPNIGIAMGMTADAPNFYTAWTDGRLCSPDIFAASVRRSDIPSCQSIAEGYACDDGDPCTTGETCQNRVCVPAGEVSCNAPATECRQATTVCDSRAGCVGEPKPDGTVCGAKCSLPSTCSEGACVNDPAGGGDPDADLFCSLDDNCPWTANSDQADLDEDGLGNVCDPADVELTMNKLSVRRSTSFGSFNGSILLRGEFILKTPGDSLDVIKGVAFRLKDSQNLDFKLNWPSSTCTRLSNGSTRCRYPIAPYHTVDYRPLPTNTAGLRTVLVTVRIRKQNLKAPFVAPLTAWVTNKPGTLVLGIDRAGSTLSCRSLDRGLECAGSGGDIWTDPTVTPTPVPTPAPPPPCVDGGGGYGSPSRAFLGGPSDSLLD